MSVSKDSTKVGFIGLGIMGARMARHILDAGYEMHVYNRSKAKGDGLVERGAVWHDGPGEVASHADVIITMVGYPEDVEEVYLAPGGIVERSRKGAYLIDMTTSKPSLAVKVYEAAGAEGQHALDAPVSGGEMGAREGRLSIMVGGDAAAFDHVKPLLDLIGENIVLQGGAGAGQHTKMCNQIVVAGNMLAMCEGLAYAKKSGLDPTLVLKSIGTGAAGSFLLNALGPKVLDGDFAPGFFVHHFIKDMDIAIGEGDTMGLELPALKVARGLYQRLADDGGREDGTQALFKVYDD